MDYIYAEKPGLEPGMVHVLILRSIALTLPLFQRLPFRHFSMFACHIFTDGAGRLTKLFHISH